MGGNVYDDMMPQFLETKVDTLLREGPGVLLGVLVTSHSNDPGIVVLYDGSSTDGRKMLDVRAPTNLTYFVEFKYPLSFREGLYVDVGGDVDSCVVLWYPEEDG